MRCKKLVGQLMCGAAIGAIAMAPLAARAQDATAMSSNSVSATSSEPVAVSGTVVRYYTDRSGYVTAADVQTANGIQMVHFSPGMGQRLYTMAPTGGQINVWVTPNPMGAGHWDVVGVGADRPAAGFMTPYSVSGLDLLEAEPYILAGAQLMTVKGTLRNVVTAKNGEVLAIVIDNASMGTAALGKKSTDAATGADATATAGGYMTHGMMMSPMSGTVIVRVPREVRHISPGAMGTGRVTPLFRGSDIKAKGYVEAPRYGALSTFSNRFVANAIVVDGRSVGALGVPMMPRDRNRTLFGGLDIDMPGGTASPEEMNAMQLGYTTYSTDGSMGGSGTASGSTGAATGGTQ